MISSARPGLAQRSPLSELWRSLLRERALIALFALTRQKSRDLRAARWYAFGVFVTYALAIALGTAADPQQRAEANVRAVLVLLSWVVGALASLGAARLLSEHAERDALRGLALQRGFSNAAVLRASTLATAARIARLVGLPTLLLIALGLARGGTLAWALRLAPAVLVYVAALSLSLAVLAQLSAVLAPRNPRAFLAALVLCPLLVSQAFSAVPSLPGALSALLARLLQATAAA